MKAAKGIYCALVTPLTEKEEIDVEGVEKLARHVIAGGVDGLLALGSTGEQIALARESKRRMLQTLRAVMPSDMPLMAGCGATSTKLAIENIRDAEEAGADAVILTPPCFYPFGDDALVAYFTQAAAAAHVPVYLYNISRFVGVRIGSDVVRRLLDNPMIMGIKESDRDEEYLQKLLDIAGQREDFAVIQGSERIFTKSFDRGCSAGVTVVGNLAPSIAPALYRAWREKRTQDAEALQRQLLEYVSVITLLGMFPQELKMCMSRKGICKPYMTSPFTAMTNRQRETLLCALAELEKKYPAVN